jgi:hypothetical protein
MAITDNQADNRFFITRLKRLSRTKSFWVVLFIAIFLHWQSSSPSQDAHVKLSKGFVDKCWEVANSSGNSQDPFRQNNALFSVIGLKFHNDKRLFTLLLTRGTMKATDLCYNIQKDARLLTTFSFNEKNLSILSLEQNGNKIIRYEEQKIAQEGSRRVWKILSRLMLILALWIAVDVMYPRKQKR